MMLRLIPYYIIIFLLLVIFFLQECRHPDNYRDPKCPPTVSDTVVQIQTQVIPVVRYYPIPEPYAVVDSFWHNVDTSFILRNCIATFKSFASLNVYNRQLLNDSTGNLVIHDSVQYNKLKSFSLSGQVNVRSIYHTITVRSPPKTQLFLGSQFGSNLNQLYIVPSFFIITPKSHFYSLGYEPFQKFVFVGLAWKIHF